MRDDLGVLGGAKAKRANWETIEKLVDVTEQEPISVTWHNNISENNVEIDK